MNDRAGAAPAGAIINSIGAECGEGDTVEKTATKGGARESPDADAAPGESAPAPKKRPAAIDPHRVRNLAQALGDPVQVVLLDSLDPIEVLGDSTYWLAIPQKVLPIGSRFELTNDAGTYLFEVWVRGAFGASSSGLRDIRFFHRVVWDERDEAVADPFVPTGRWEVRYDGRYYEWRVYRPNGAVVAISFQSQGQAEVYRRVQEGNPRS